MPVGSFVKVDPVAKFVAGWKECGSSSHESSFEAFQWGSSISHSSGSNFFVSKKSFLIINSKDYHYFPYKQHSMMAVFVHLDDTDQSNGGLGVFPGSHLQGPQVEKREKNSSRNQQILLLFIMWFS